ncbi:preprotein translocase subunit Sec61beta [Candidatus Woesearchaeota archaeon]|nr:preprotein translocase subunit Sec61beta [Candidatus Woesearchaeota archaeon]
MAEERVGLPSAGGGLVRYFEDYKSKVKFKPVVLLIVIGAVILLGLYLYKFGVK